MPVGALDAGVKAKIDVPSGTRRRGLAVAARGLAGPFEGVSWRTSLDFVESANFTLARLVPPNSLSPTLLSLM